MFKSIKNPLKIMGAFAVSCCAMALQPAWSSDPHLAFSDLISGPDTGLGDGQGSGVIVTVWGQNLGIPSSNRTLYFKDSGGQTYEPHVYYWKQADGTLPSGPADLYSSHRMQEIAFSIPDSAQGLGQIYVDVNGQVSNSLPFTVRSGKIFHVKSNGNDSSDGSWGAPWRTATHAVDTAPAGSTIYIQDVNTGSSSSARGIYWNNNPSSSTLAAQFSIVAYPGYQPKVTAQRAVENYTTEAMVVSKLDLYASNYTSVSSTGQPSGSEIDNGSTFAIQTTKNGRAVGNRVGDIPGGCASKYQGAITGNAKYGDRVSNYKIFGNEVYDYGCEGSNKLHHTTYMSIRSDGKDLQLTPWEYGYNYLHGNKAKFGIHQFDQNAGCGDLTGPIKIHDNVIVDQAGAGISIGSECGWSMDAYIQDNVLINVGLAASWDGVDPNTSQGPENGGISIRDSGLLGTMYVRNNLIYGYTADAQSEGTGGRGCLNLNGSGDNVSIVWQDNICYTEKDRPFIGIGYQADNKVDNISGGNNVWFFAGGSPSFANVPSWDANAIETDPLLIVDKPKVTLDDGSSLVAESPIINKSLTAPHSVDLYGNARGTNPDIGPIEYMNAAPLPPSGVIIN